MGNTIIERIKKDKKFTAELYAEAISSLLEGDIISSLSILQDLIRAHISFKSLSEQMGLNENILHNMLNNKETPSIKNIILLIRHPSFISLHFSGFEFFFSRNKTKKVLTTFGAI
ncbi:hypothetical protein GMMP15_1650001 [Candidatus Magnetomoraceae bacterium gMMP-15]